jgi:hypothetical protein
LDQLHHLPGRSPIWWVLHLRGERPLRLPQVLCEQHQHRHGRRLQAQGLGNDTYSPDDDEKYDDNETFNPKSKNGKLEFWLQRREKPEEKKDDDDDEKKCKESKIYLTLTNLERKIEDAFEVPA